MTLAIAERILAGEIKVEPDLWYQAMCLVMAERAAA